MLNNCKSKKNNIVIAIFTWVLIILIAMLISIFNNPDCDFISFNGDFQNYNPIRRFLAGQIPYKDFIDYLGLGHLYLGSIATILFGGSFYASKIAFNFLSIISLILVVYVLARSIFQDSKNSKYIILAVLGSFAVIRVFSQIGRVFSNLFFFRFFYISDFSARNVRGLIIPLIVIIVSFLLTHFENRKFIEILIPILVGGCFGFNNDYGISCFICGNICYILISIAQHKKDIKTIVKKSLSFILLSICGVFIFVFIFTLGHVKEWIYSTFGIGSFQYWYYNSPKSFFVYNIDSRAKTLMLFIIAIYYFVKLLRTEINMEKIIRYAVPMFMCLTLFCQVNEYKMLSGGDNTTFAYAVLFFTVLFEVIAFLKSKLHNKYLKVDPAQTKIIKYVFVIKMLICFCSVLFVFALFGKVYHTRKVIAHDSAYIYFKELGGYLNQYSDDLIAAKKFLNGKKVFSTYSSALEVCTNQFQPSGIDYIIHVLGDKSREKYLSAFRRGNFDYVITLNPKQIYAEPWIERANWFFYEELYKNYEPVFQNNYQLFWQRKKEPVFKDIAAHIDITKRSASDIESSYKLTIHTDKNFSGWANICLSYSQKKFKRKKSIFVFRSLVNIDDNKTIHIFDKIFYPNNLRSSMSTKRSEIIPCTIINGEGELIVKSEPAGVVGFDSIFAECENGFSTPFDYVTVVEMQKFGRYSALKLVNNEINAQCLKNATKILLDENNTVDIISWFTRYDENLIYIMVERQNSLNRVDLKKKNVFRILNTLIEGE